MEFSGMKKRIVNNFILDNILTYVTYAKIR